jgi:hypothetical protein
MIIYKVMPSAIFLIARIIEICTSWFRPFSEFAMSECVGTVDENVVKGVTLCVWR